jgi:8-oxo-dGTP diphosphatase
MSDTPIHVVACALLDAVGRVLICQRPTGRPMAGYWEFPGGKIEKGEERLAGLRRELDEELGVSLISARPLIRLRHDYPDFSVDLDVWAGTDWRGDVEPKEGQAMAWAAPEDLHHHTLLPADGPVVGALRLPETIVITPDSGPGSKHRRGITDLKPERSALLIRCKSPTHRRAWASLAREAVPEMKLFQHGLDDGLGDDRVIHLDGHALAELERRPDANLVGASCHDLAQINRACELGLDYAFISPVNKTRSHPDQTGLGWTRFAALAGAANMPVYALGGVGPDDLSRAWEAGAQGIAGISAFWGE